MKKKLIIYLLAAVMVLSPAAVFADAAADTPNDDAAVTELEQVSSDAQLTLYSKGTWNSTKTQFIPEGSTVPAKGLFKAPKSNTTDIVALFYANSSGIVAAKATFVTATEGPFYSYIRKEAAFDINPGLSGPVTYYQKQDPDFGCYCIQSTVGIFTADGKKCYVQDNATVKTTAGFITVSGKKYYVTAGGPIRSQAGFFNANDGKTYLSDSTGAIVTTAGIRKVGSSYYAIQSGGAVVTKVGLAKVGGKLCYVSNNKGVLAVSKEVKVNGKKYHVKNDATIAIGGHKWGKKYYYSDDSGIVRTKKGVFKAGGKYYFVKKGGALAINKKVKYKGKTYIAAKSGVLYTGLFKWKKNKYYASSKAVVRTKAGVIKHEGLRYYVKKGGKIRTNALFTAKGKKYCANKDGSLKYGHFKWGSNYYLTNDKCVIYTKKGIYKFGSTSYFVESGGKLGNQEFEELNDKHYFANSKGAVVKKKFTYKRNGKSYTITPNSKTGVISDEDYYRVFPEKAPDNGDDNNTTN